MISPGSLDYYRRPRLNEMELPPPPPALKLRLGGIEMTSDVLSLMKPEAPGIDESENSPLFRQSNPWELQFSHSETASSAVASISPTAPVSGHDHHCEDFSIDDNFSAVMGEPSSWLSRGREAPPLSPSTLVVDGNLPSTSPGKGSSSSPRVPTTDLPVYGMDKLPAYLDIAAQCLVRVQEMPSRKFNNEQCGYLVDKLIDILGWANHFLESYLRAHSKVKHRTSEDMTRCTDVFKLLLALALKIESFIEGCCRDKWLQAAMTLTNTAEYVASLGFNLELCRVYFDTGWTGTKALTAAQVDNIDRNEVEIVKRKASLDVDVLLDKVISDLPSLQAEDKDLGIYLLQRLKRVRPVSTSLSPDSPFRSAFDDLGFLGRIFQRVRQNEQLGKGTSAIVHKALWLGTPVAKKTFYGPKHPDYVREARILAGLCHPNIMSMFCCAMDKRKCSIVMELMDEDLHSFMQRRLDANPHSPPFSVFEAVDVILQIGEGVNYLHENGIMHRDLKSFNILVKNVLPADLEVQYVLIKVADFGFAKIRECSTRYSNQSSNVGTNRWMPPEVINLHSNDGKTSAFVLQAGPKYPPKSSDVYSFGMVCYEILTGDLPFAQETSLVNIKKKVLNGERPTLPDHCPSILKDLIAACWDREPTRRPSFASICSSLKHLKCLLMGGLKSNEDSHVVIAEPLPMSPEITPFKAPTRELVVRRSPEPLPMSSANTPCEPPAREMVVQKKPVQWGLVKSLFTVWRRPFRIFISHAGGSEMNFPIRLYLAFERHRWSRSNVRIFLDHDAYLKGRIFAGESFKELARCDVGLVVVTPDFFEKKWPMTELVKLFEVRRVDWWRKIRVLPMFYWLTPNQVKRGLHQGKWDQHWAEFSAGNHPLQVQECRDAISSLHRTAGIVCRSRLHERDYITEILAAVDSILYNERSFAADLRWIMSLLQRK